MSNNVLIIDFGSQTTQLIARVVRKMSVYCEIYPFTKIQEGLNNLNPSAIILSGGPASVYESDDLLIDKHYLEMNIPILGICYGAQLIVHLLGGKVEKTNTPEYGGTLVSTLNCHSTLYNRFLYSGFMVWMNHNDAIFELPDGFEITSYNKNTPICSFENVDKKLYGVQFHPEVYHTSAGETIIEAFLVDIAGLKKSYSVGSIIDLQKKNIENLLSENDHVVLGLSGGVDSSVTAALLHSIIGDRLHCIFVDHGLLRLNEVDEVRSLFTEKVPLDLSIIDAKDIFLKRLSRITDPEQKRKIIGYTFIEIFEKEAKKYNAKYLAQGTLYPDVIESISVHGYSAVIKTHHNVGGLPEKMNLKLIEPLRSLFKDEVRAIGKQLGLPDNMVYRHPFPGPGLAIRCIGEVTFERLDLLRKADYIFIEELHKANLYRDVWQAFCVLLPVQTVGFMGDSRTYENVIALRAVSSRDVMTVDWYRLPQDFLAEVSKRITNEVNGCNRVVYDITSKPPGTVEWE